MTDNLTIFGDLADDFDAFIAHGEAEIDDFVVGHGYSLTWMALMSTTKSVMEFPKSFADIGRIGNGIVLERSWKGVAKDGLRILSVAGGLTKAATRLLRVTQIADQSTCAWVAATNQLRLTGSRFLITLEQLVDWSGGSLPKIIESGSLAPEYEQMRTFIRAFGTPSRLIRSASVSITDGLAAIRTSPNGVITFAVRYMDKGKPAAHALYATFTRLGGLVIHDPLGPSYRTVADLIKRFGSEVALHTRSMMYLENSAVVRGVTLAADAAGAAFMAKHIALQVVPVVLVRAADPHTAVQVLAVREQVAGATRATALTAQHARRHVVRRGENLTLLSARYYGTPRKWPVIYEANRQIIGRNPDLIQPGQKFLIPNLTHLRHG